MSDTPTLLREALERAFMRVNNAHGPNAQVEDDGRGQPCDWCKLAAGHAEEALNDPAVRTAAAAPASEPLPNEAGVSNWPGGGGRVSKDAFKQEWFTESGGAWVVLYAPCQFYDGLRTLASEPRTPTLDAGFTVVYGEPAPAPGTTVIEGLRCSTCGLDLVVPLFHPGQANVTDHKPTLASQPAASWPSAPFPVDIVGLALYQALGHLYPSLAEAENDASTAIAAILRKRERAALAAQPDSTAGER